MLSSVFDLYSCKTKLNPVLHVAPGLALSHCRVGWAGALPPGMFGWVLEAAPGLPLPHCRVSWAGALSPRMSCLDLDVAPGFALPLRCWARDRMDAWVYDAAHGPALSLRVGWAVSPLLAGT